jgi:hypothetical protein
MTLKLLGSCLLSLPHLCQSSAAKTHSQKEFSPDTMQRRRSAHQQAMAMIDQTEATYRIERQTFR